MTVYHVVAIAILNLTGHKGSKVIIALFALELGASEFLIGILVATYAVCPLLLAVKAGRLADRYGVFWPVVAGSLGATLGLVLAGLYPGIPALFASAFLIGFSFAFFQVSVQSMVGAIGTKETRTRDYLTFSLGPAIAGVFGPTAAGFGIDHLGYGRAYLMLAVFTLIPAVLMVVMRRQVPAGRSARADDGGGVFDLMRSATLAPILVVSGSVITAIELFMFYFPVYGKSIGLSASWIGVILATYAFASFVVRVFVPPLTERRGEYYVLSYALIAAGAVYCLFPFFASPWLLMAVAFVLGLGLGCGQPMSLLLVYNAAPPGRVSEALGLRITINKLTEIVCPVAFGALGAAFGVVPVFVSNGALLSGAGWLTRVAGRRSGLYGRPLASKRPA